MEHLSLESLSRLVDETPAPEERAHLSSCAACAEELEALAAQTATLGSLPDLRPPVGDWDVIEARLVSEGLVKRRSGITGMLAVTPAWMRAAAALLLFLSGTAVGAFGVRTRAQSADPEQTFATFASSVGTAEEAAEWVRTTERHYIDALLRHRQLVEVEGGSDALADPATRIAALDHLVRAGQVAVRQAPADPFFNGLLASAMAERQSAIRRVSARPAAWF